MALSVVDLYARVLPRIGGYQADINGEKVKESISPAVPPQGAPVRG